VKAAAQIVPLRSPAGIPPSRQRLVVRRAELEAEAKRLGKVDEVRLGADRKCGRGFEARAGRGRMEPC
jgi:hypothetical protein